MAKSTPHPCSYLFASIELIVKAIKTTQKIDAPAANQIISYLMEAINLNEWAYDVLGRLEYELAIASATANDRIEELEVLRKSHFNRKPDNLHNLRNNIILAETAKNQKNCIVMRMAKTNEAVRRDTLRRFAKKLNVETAELKKQLVNWGNQQNEQKIEITPDSARKWFDKKLDESMTPQPSIVFGYEIRSLNPEANFIIPAARREQIEKDISLQIKAAMKRIETKIQKKMKKIKSSPG